MTEPREQTSLWSTAAGLATLAVLTAYAALIHHGLGPLPDGPIEPWTPREFLLRQSWISPFEERPLLGVAAFTVPAALLCALVFVWTRSALARTAALACVIGTVLFSFYGLRSPGPGIWRFFGWRGSGVMAGLAVTLAATALAPLLARSWLRLPPAARVLAYLPVFVAVVVILRNVTGTDPGLRFAISPWPVVPLFGMTIGCVAILGVIAAMACAAYGCAPGENGRSGLRMAGGLLVAVLLPALWFRLWHESFPPRGMIALSVVGAAFVGAALLRADAGRDLHTRARHLAWGFALALVPLLAGEALAGFDYSRTREGAARQLIDALDAYYEQHEEYPDELSTLVDEGYIREVPRPRIGFAFLGQQEFEYQSFGISYNLEFSSPDWVQCAYNPSWAEESWDDEEDWDDEPEEAEPPVADGETALDESWSCPSSPPELW
ncbi:MAG: hypothetical protein HKP30_09145 [Myxococcales bacterium]|nr:hypothetical protein [Myxococcales bacterium]